MPLAEAPEMMTTVPLEPDSIHSAREPGIEPGIDVGNCSPDA